MAVIDFETRTTVELKHTGPYPYAQHPTTEPLCLGYRLNGWAGTKIWLPWMPPPHELFDAIAAGEIIHAHNAMFEKVIWRYVMAARYGWPPIPETQLRCIAARAAVVGLPRGLAKAAQLMGLPVQKDKEGHAVMMKMTKPRKWLKSEIKRGWVSQLDLSTGYYRRVAHGERAIYHDTIEDLQKLVSYCRDDCDTEWELEKRLPELNRKEQVVWFLDQRINDRGIRVDRPTAACAVEIANEVTERLNSRIDKLTNGHVTAGSKVKDLKTWIERRMPHLGGLPNLDKERLAWLLSQPDTPPDVKHACRIRQEAGKVSNAKYRSLLSGASQQDDRIRDTLLYCGAGRTGRWAGKRVQPHNMPREGFDVEQIEEVVGAIRTANVDYLASVAGEPMKSLSWCLRNCLVAAPGHRLLVSDLSAVEARGLCWLAGEDWKLRAFADYDTITGHDDRGKPIRAGKDMYVLSADRVRELTGLDTGDAKEHRQLGKVCELALGYQGWVGAFQTFGSIYRIYVPDDTAADIAAAWRKAHPMITSWWSMLEESAILAIQNPGRAYKARRVTFWVHGSYLICQLPSGRRLYYVNPKVRNRERFGKTKLAISYEGIDSYTHQWVRIDTYGGKLAENITQAVCRDFLVEGMLNLENAGYPIVLHVHDEVVSELPYGYGNIHQVENLMTQMPAWADGCPLAAEGFESERYRK